MTNAVVHDFINEHTYDIRVSGNGRWIDQKCTMDVVCFVADCIVDYIQNGGQQPFQSPDIWHSDYAVQSVQDFFGKPDPMNYSAHDEFNKFFRQPMKMLAAAGVLKENGRKKATIQFSVANMEVLEFIALREKNAYNFLCMYVEKTLKDSGLWGSFERFFDAQDKTEYQNVKERFSEFSIQYTKIGTTVEANRIFTKVLNILACKYHKKGSERGHISKKFITFDKIMYNQVNWRDELSGKEKNVARRDYNPAATVDSSYYKYRIDRAIKNLRQFNDKYNHSRSEVLDAMSIGNPATHMHHIFPKNTFAEIADYLENLIAITAGQHMQKAHPDGNTQIVDRDFQYLCLLCKTESIKQNILGSHNVPVIYSFECFTHVLATGLGKPEFEELAENDFEAVINHIEVCY
ncbi:MAG: restriction endonuclease [Oscillospiraceae bacterium]|nr:restriction endonuclease [Oscillospiraceae bacterium]